MDKPTCRTCPYWDATGGDEGVCELAPAAYVGPPGRPVDATWAGWWQQPTTFGSCACASHPAFPAWIEGSRRISAPPGSLETPVYRLDVGVRERKVIHKSGCETVKELAELGDDELRCIRGCGDRTLENIRRALFDGYGLILKPSAPYPSPAPADGAPAA
jgi:hypothetical protein